MADSPTSTPDDASKAISTMREGVIETKLVLGKPKLSRTSTQKVRTGCITCKKRHVKCDETRPSCNNCLKSRGRCGGYGFEPRTKISGPFQNCWDSRQPVRKPPPRVTLHVDPISSGFLDPKGLLYFQEFLSLTQGPWVTGASNGALWAVTLPQMTNGNDTLRSAAMAIGALSIWHRQSTHGSLNEASTPVLPVAEGDVHYFQAVSYYCNALKLQSQGTSVQNAIFLSILLLFFETLRGNRKGALDHVNHGLALLFALLTDDNAERHIANFAADPTPVLGGVADVFMQLITQIRTVLPGRISQGSPFPNLTKGLRSKRKTLEHFMVLLSKQPSSASIDNIPDFFTTLDEVEEYWSAARRRQITMATIIRESIQGLGIPKATDNERVNDFYQRIMTASRIQDFSSTSQGIFKSLNDAYLPLFNNIVMSDTESPTYMRALHLRLELVGAYIFEDPTQYVDFQNIYLRTPLFREFLSLVEMATRLAKRDITNPAHQFSLQCGLAWRILITSFFCRDPLTRDEATWMLKEYTGQDGLFNTRSLYAIATRNRYIERENSMEGTPQEQWKRLWRREFVFEDGGDRIILRYLERDPATGAWSLVEEAADFHRDSEHVVWRRQPLSGSGGLLMLEIGIVSDGQSDFGETP